MTAWTIAPCLLVLRDEVDGRWPNRSKASDGFIGDAAHAATWSDHNPNSEGVVCAFDITNDPDGPTGWGLAETFRQHPHPDVKYVIWNRSIFSRYPVYGYEPFQWRPYSGADPHTSHVHVSVGVGPDGRSAPWTYNDVSSWFYQPIPLPTFKGEDMFTYEDQSGNWFQVASGKLTWLDDVARVGAQTAGVPHYGRMTAHFHVTQVSAYGPAIGTP